jgi:hypothetical protein
MCSDNLAISDQFIARLPSLMAEPEQQPKKETVRIEAPLPPATKPPEPTEKPRETVRIQLPVRETGGPPLSSSPQSAPEDISSTNFFPPPKPPAASRPLSASARPSPATPPPGPKRETVRIPLMPEPLRSAQKKTQPLIAMPEVAPQNPSIAVAPAEKSSMLLYWMLFGFSALILIIQIWTYFS